MRSSDNSNFIELLEEIRNQNKATLAAIGAMCEELSDLPTHGELEELKAEMRAIIDCHH